MSLNHTIFVKVELRIIRKTAARGGMGNVCGTGKTAARGGMGNVCGTGKTAARGGMGNVCVWHRENCGSFMYGKCMCVAQGKLWLVYVWEMYVCGTGKTAARGGMGNVCVWRREKCGSCRYGKCVCVAQGKLWLVEVWEMCVCVAQGKLWLVEVWEMYVCGTGKIVARLGMGNCVCGTGKIVARLCMGNVCVWHRENCGSWSRMLEDGNCKGKKIDWKMILEALATEKEGKPEICCVKTDISKMDGPTTLGQVAI
ncbi:hypothetical protein HNY73_008007 [Argiope bruennichi]|uniref:Uncharacterized protein n=1 Tax=Argiope bruennichi TaxID=94029 RepID=A0A8T0FBF0_ARGBR|nr:hypothetical protein HNY73_008007 [Argiope bruennichi]